MRILAGRFRGRRLMAPPGFTTRPTAQRTREALFNILEHGDLAQGGRPIIAGAHVLDAFSGSGALGFEALSHDAAHVTLIDHDAKAIAIARNNVMALDVDGQVTLVRADVLAPGPAPMLASVVFLDPPYGKALAAPALVALALNGWLAPGALAVVEVGLREDLQAPRGFDQLDERRYGAARLLFFRYAPTIGTA
ncbi:MAG: 16S rRNA (guanine(966)-N(2))-methyltransferase RsmD [Alphaproteobacteria bacterium]|nr:16S rRNA (guanine(966)-N(2))-methyltransferase RsmD [Alphaproteobacteria bacterium]